MDRFDPASMSPSTSPTVRALRTFVERTVEAEIERVAATHDAHTVTVVEASLRAAVYAIFHHNPDVHTRVQRDPSAFDAAVQSLFGISGADTVEEDLTWHLR